MLENNRFKIMLADKKIEITNIYSYTEKLCKDYVITEDSMLEQIDYRIETTDEDIDFEREKSAREDVLAGVPVREFSNEYLESLAVYRKIAELLIADSTFLFHGSCVAVDGVAYLFTAKSGTGKSTHTRLWRKIFGKRAVMVNDDKPLIHLNAGGAAIYGTPWDGKHRLSNNIVMPLKSICILKRANGGENRITELTKRQALPMLIQQSYRPRDIVGLKRTLELIDKLADSVKLYELYCNIDEDAVHIAYELMRI